MTTVIHTWYKGNSKKLGLQHVISYCAYTLVFWVQSQNWSDENCTFEMNGRVWESKKMKISPGNMEQLIINLGPFIYYVRFFMGFFIQFTSTFFTQIQLTLSLWQKNNDRILFNPTMSVHLNLKRERRTKKEKKDPWLFLYLTP